MLVIVTTAACSSSSAGSPEASVRSVRAPDLEVNMRRGATRSERDAVRDAIVGSRRVRRFAVTQATTTTTSDDGSHGFGIIEPAGDFKVEVRHPADVAVLVRQFQKLDGVNGVANFAALPSDPVGRRFICNLVRNNLQARPFALVFFMGPEATAEQTASVGATLGRDPHVRRVRFVSREQAEREGILRPLSDAQAGPPYFAPESFRVDLRPNTPDDVLLPRILELPGVAAVDFPTSHRYPKSLTTICHVDRPA